MEIKLLNGSTISNKDISHVKNQDTFFGGGKLTVTYANGLIIIEKYIFRSDAQWDKWKVEKFIK